MVIGLILSGMILGTGAGLAALISGFSFGTAFALYMVCGSAWILGGTGIMAVRAALGDAPAARVRIGAQRN